MTATIVEHDEDIVVEEELDKPDPCDWKTHGGDTCQTGEPAKWKIVFSCCANTYHRCQEHFDSMVDTINAYRRIFCARCKTVHDPPHKILGMVTRL